MRLSLTILLALFALREFPRAAIAGQAAANAQPVAEKTEQPAAQPDPELPTLDKKELPSAAKLLAGPAVDWIVITGDKVLEVEPLYPRPGTLDELNKKLNDFTRLVGANPAREADKAKRNALYYLHVTLLDGDEREYKLHRQYVKEIIYFEDLMLRRIDKLLDERKVLEAFQVLTALEARQTNWSGLVARQERLLFTEAAVTLDAGQSERSLVLLEELHDRNTKYAGLSAAMGVAADRLISDALAHGDHRQVRHFILRLKRKEPNHAVAAKWTADLQNTARTLIDKATTFERNGEFDKAAELIDAAARVWPPTSDLAAAHRRMCNRYQTLRVGVVDLPDEFPNYPVTTPAKERQQQLTPSPLFLPARSDERVTRFASPFFEEWEPTDLGHSLRFRLRRFRESWESRPLVTAGTVVNVLARRMDPRDSLFDERFAGYVESLSVRSPDELAVQFRQVPLRPEALFTLSLEGIPGPFRTHAAEAHRHVYRRTQMEAERGTDWHVAEIVETKYGSHELALQALYRGDVSLLPTVPAWNVAALANRQEFFTLPYALPVTHILQFNPHSKLAASRTLRRALVYAVDRPRILETTVLHEPAGKLGRPTSAPVPTTSYAYNSLVEPHKFDASLGLSLSVAAKKDLGGELPAITVLCPADAVPHAAAQQIAEHWRRIGLNVTLVTAAEYSTAKPAPAWDVVYRTVRIYEPLTELWPLLTLGAATDVESLSHVPTWLRHDLVSLDLAGDWLAAEAILRKLHKQLWAEVYLIPLWETNEYLVARKHIRGLPPQPLATYQGIERWKVDPWYPRD